MLKLNILQDKLLKYLPEDQFESLEIPLTVNATDIINGKLIEFNSGKLSIPILASCSVPGLFEPLVYHDKLLIDGGVLCNLPIEPLIESKCDFIFASHCNPLRPLQSNSPNIRALIARSLFMSIHKTSTEKAKICDFFIEPQELVTVKRYSFSKIDTIFKMGYEATKVLEDKILKNMAQKS